MRWSDRLGIAISVGCLAALAVGVRLAFAQTTPAVEQAVFNANSASALSSLAARVQKLEDLHLERVLGQLDALTKVGYMVVAGLVGNLVSTILQIKRSPNARRR